VPVSERIQNLVSTYGGDHFISELSTSFEKISQRLGGQHIKAALEALQNNDFQKAAAIALTYYDKTYYFGLEQSSALIIEKMHSNGDSPTRLAERLLECVEATSINNNGI
jgi:tRNA 2-selenouridine synthase